MAVAVRSASIANANGTSTLAVTKPSGTASGDLLVAIVWADSDAVQTAITAPTGSPVWTQAGSTIPATSPTSPGGKVFWKAAGGSEGSSYTFGISSAASTVIHMFALTGADTTTPIRVVPTVASGTTAAVVAPTITSGSGQTSGDLLVCSFGVQGGTNSFSTPSGMTDTFGAVTTDNTTTWVSGESAVLALSGTGATGTKTSTSTITPTNSWRALSMVVAGLVVARTGSATAAMTLSATRTGAKGGIGSRTAAMTLGASSSGTKGGIGTRTAAMTLGASTSGARATSGSRTAAMVLTASGPGQRINLGLAIMTLSASTAGTVHTSGSARTAPMTLGASTTAVHTSGSARTAAMALAATQTGGKAQAGARTAAMTLAASETALKQANGARTAAMVLSATRAALKQAVGARTAAMALAASLSGTIHTGGSTRTAAMLLSAATTATRANGSARTAAMLLSASSTGTRIVVEVTGGALTARAQITVPYELVCVQRIPQTSGPPSFEEVDPIDWTGLSYVDELSKPQQLNAGAKISNLTEPVLQRLRNLAELATELWLYRNGKLIFAGPLLGWQIQGESLTFQAQGLLAYLKMMIVTSDEVFAQADQFTIATTLIDQWQALDYGNFGIDTTGVGTSGVLRDATYLQKELHPVGQRVEELGARENGFDVSIDPATRKLQLAYPLQGLDRSTGEDAIVFDARNVTSPNIVCSAAPGDVASEAFGTGTGDSTVYSVESNLVRRAQYGRTAVAATFDGVSEQATLDAHVQGMLNVRNEALLIPGPDVRVTTDSDLSSYDVGDTVSYQLHSQLSVGGAFRLRKRTVTVSNTGQESVSVGFA